MKVAVVGCGYVGLVSGVGLASVGHEVVGVEVNELRRSLIAAGITPFHEPGLEERLGSVLGSGAFRISGDVAAVREAEIILVAVQTPPRPDGSNDPTHLLSAARDVADALREGDDRPRVVAVRSTAVPGTVADLVAPIFAGLQVAVASNPEFLREGSAIADYLEPDRVVIGCDEPWGRALLQELYRPFDAPVVLTGPSAAELAKYASNAFLATVISFSNELSRIARALPGVDIDQVLGAVHLDRRLTNPKTGEAAELVSYLKAGCGYGGSCLPKDVAALVARSEDLDVESALLRAVRSVNETQPQQLVDLVRGALGSLAGRRVTLLGLAFKGGTDDLRDSPGLRVLDLLVQAGCRITVHDPLVGIDAIQKYAGSGVRVAETLLEALSGAEACVVTSNAPEFLALEQLVPELEQQPVVVDGRRFLTPERFPSSTYLGIGLGSAREPVAIGVEPT